MKKAKSSLNPTNREIKFKRLSNDEGLLIILFCEVNSCSDALCVADWAEEHASSSPISSRFRPPLTVLGFRDTSNTVFFSFSWKFSFLSPKKRRFVPYFALTFSLNLFSFGNNPLNNS